MFLGPYPELRLVVVTMKATLLSGITYWTVGHCKYRILT